MIIASHMKNTLSPRTQRFAEMATWIAALIVACMPLASILVQGRG